MNLRPLLLLLSLAAFASGCQSDLDLRYLDASVGGSLELPPDLIRSEEESSFELPEVFSGDDASVRDRVPVLANVRSLRLEGSQNLYWLSIEEPVDNLYQLVKNFWASEGYRLVVDEPVIGVMQTEWIYKRVGTDENTLNWLERLFGVEDLSAVQDQFKTRIDRDDGGRSRVYIAHRGAEYKHVLDSKEPNPKLLEADEDADWQYRRPDPELEVEMLSRLMIYLGMQKAEVEQQVANARLFKPRAYLQHDAEENSPFLLIKDTYHIAWNRVYHNLERLNFEIEKAQFRSGFAEQGVFTVNIDVRQASGSRRLFSADSGDEVKKRKIQLILSEQSHEFTRVNIEDANGEFDTSPEGAEFLALLYQHIK